MSRVTLLVLLALSALAQTDTFEAAQEKAERFTKAGQYAEAMAVLRAGHERGLFFGLSMPFEWLKPLEKLPEFASLVARDGELRERAERTASMRYEMVKPAGYSPSRKYPLFIELHAGNDSIEGARRYWTSPALARNYLTAYVQSARPMTSKTCGWRMGDAEARAGLRKIYDEIVAKYPVDTGRVLIGGMSAGGMMSLDVVVHNVLPVTGYVVNCGIAPDDFEPKMADGMRKRGVRGVLITGENDFGLERLKSLVEVFKQAGVVHRFTIIPGMGHEIPKDFPSRLDAALAEVGQRAAQ